MEEHKVEVFKVSQKEQVLECVVEQFAAVPEFQDCG